MGSMYSPFNARAHLGGAFGNATQTFILDDVKCLGEESSIFDCPSAGLFTSECGYTEAAGVSCL